MLKEWLFSAKQEWKDAKKEYIIKLFLQKELKSIPELEQDILFYCSAFGQIELRFAKRLSLSDTIKMRIWMINNFSDDRKLKRKIDKDGIIHWMSYKKIDIPTIGSMNVCLILINADPQNCKLIRKTKQVDYYEVLCENQ